VFLEPNVTDDYELSWKSMDPGAIEDMLCDDFEFSRPRIQSTLAKIAEGEKARGQKSLDAWF
jgi:flap endonuclease-1